MSESSAHYHIRKWQYHGSRSTYPVMLEAMRFLDSIPHRACDLRKPNPISSQIDRSDSPTNDLPDQRLISLASAIHRGPESIHRKNSVGWWRFPCNTSRGGHSYDHDPQCRELPYHSPFQALSSDPEHDQHTDQSFPPMLHTVPSDADAQSVMASSRALWWHCQCISQPSPTSTDWPHSSRLSVGDGP